MSLTNKIYKTTIGAVIAIAAPVIVLHAQEKKRHKYPVTITAKSGAGVCWNNLSSKTSLRSIFTDHSICVKTTVNKHISIETGINFTELKNTLGESNKQFQMISVPAIVQYKLFPKMHRVHPYCGAGIQCDRILSSAYDPSFGETKRTGSLLQTGTKYINIVFTQGVTFEVNTKIDIAESIHFIPGSDKKRIGIDLGIGYKLP